MKLQKQSVDFKYAVPTERKPSRHDAILSFLFGIGSFIPLLNYGISLLAIYISFQTLRKIRAKPEQFRGFFYAVIGLALGLFVTVVNIIDLVYLRWI